jgi:8-oxo-dGTP pyrophosphatase MutT (NUDIX family)
MNIVKIAAAVIVNNSDETLLVRKAGTKQFMQAGGKMDDGEEPITALIPELEEELGLQSAAEDYKYCGKFSAPAAHEKNTTVEADLFYLKTDKFVNATAEIEELIWGDPKLKISVPLAPLTEKYMRGIAQDNRLLMSDK